MQVEAKACITDSQDRVNIPINQVDQFLITRVEYFQVNKTISFIGSMKRLNHLTPTQSNTMKMCHYQNLPLIVFQVKLWALNVLLLNQ